jgi:hypothetical protein
MKPGILHEWLVRTCRAAVAVVCLGVAVPSASAQLLYSFESDLQGWANTGFTGSGASDLISVTQSTQGFTEGTHSMAVETGNAIPPDNSAFGWDVNRTVTTGSLPAVYNAFNTAAGDPTNYTLDFDISITSDSFANVSATGPFFLINVALGSSDGVGGGGFDQVFNVTPNLIGTDTMGNWVPLPPNTYHISIPFGEMLSESSSLYVVPNANYYQLNIGSNKNNTLFQNGPGPSGAIYYIDNVQIVEKPATVEETFFSWETPDNPGTPAVNEQFEGWVTGFHAGHAHSITTTGATDGSSALQIDRTSLASGFSWGSQFLITSDTNPDPEVEVIDPVIQARIDDLVDTIMGAKSVAFDLTYQYVDRFPLPDPGFTKFGLNFSDETGIFYQSEQQGFVSIPPGTPETTVTIEIPLNLFTAPSGEIMLEDGFLEGTNSFRIALSSNTDGAQIYQIDNFRFISLAPEGLPGDFNEDGKVDTADYVTWRKDGGSTEDYNLWREHFGEMAMAGGGAGNGHSAVPEPAAALVIAAAMMGDLLFRRRRSSSMVRAESVFSGGGASDAGFASFSAGH